MNKLFRTFSDKYIIFLVIILTAIYWKWWLFGPRVANDFPIISPDDLKIQFDIPRVWFFRGSVGLGGYSVYSLWSWLIDFVAGFFANFGLGIIVLERVMLVVPTILVGVISIWNLLEELRLSKVSKFIAALFYLSNTYILLLIDGGQLAIGLAFAWFPAAFLTFQKSIGGGIDKKIFAGLSFWVLGILDLRFTYVLSILLALRFFYGFIDQPKSRWVYWGWEWVRSSFVIVVMFICLNAYWLIPLSINPVSNEKFSDLTKVSNLSFTQFKHSLTLLQPHWYENIFGKIPPFRREFLLIPILVFLAPVLERKDKRVWFWTIVAIISVFLSKGNSPPFSEIYPWLFTHVPGFSLFRDSTKFFFLVALSYSVLIAFSIDSIIRKYSRFKMIFSSLIVAYFIFLSYPVYTNKMTGTFSIPRYGKEYSVVSKIFEEDKRFGRVLWIPSRPPLGYASRLHASLEASRLESLRPFAISTVGTYETQNFIREGNYMGELFDITGIRYVAYPYFDPKRDDMSQEKVDYYNTFLDQISTLPWVSEKVSDSPIPVFKTLENQEKFFLSQNTYLVVGSDRIYSELKDLAGKFSNNALIFTEENKETISQIEKLPDSKVLLYDKNLIDLTLSFASKDKFISPSYTLDSSPNGAGWWKREGRDLVWFRDFLQQKYGIDNLDFDYGAGWAIAEGEKQLELESPNFAKGNILYARIMQSSKGGEISFSQGENLIGTVDTEIENPEEITIKLTGNEMVSDRFYKYDKADFHWLKIGNLLSDGKLTIKTSGDINIVNSLVGITSKQEEELNNIVKNLNSDGRIIEWDKLDIQTKKELLGGENKASVSYETLAPTHYKVKIEGLESPTTLFFSETFDSGWELDNQKGYRLYSLINGFWIDHDGEYDLYFTAQRFVIPGLIVSIITLTSCIIVLVWKKKK